jgi:hypothetical protein
MTSAFYEYVVEPGAKNVILAFYRFARVDTVLNPRATSAEQWESDLSWRGLDGLANNVTVRRSTDTGNITSSRTFTRHCWADPNPSPFSPGTIRSVAAPAGPDGTGPLFEYWLPDTYARAGAKYVDVYIEPVASADSGAGNNYVPIHLRVHLRRGGI